MKLIRFWTKYGYKVIGGRFSFTRSPSTIQELNAPIEEVSDKLIQEAELAHEVALTEHRKSWNLD